ncbi:hypothetical protein BHECKSOX_2014 [Bathymodiolus heckerae thiotrophic gill symbiont]|uniref:hypothetical protein n=1 Tax=Bathymodiolus heckerae thiotrophic gill symbiont TaxID=1052212 RepID=UPI0010B0E4B4|nr:hypothetical protein [Bathymodiolus heckerae thiotrophic gill symbiont]CAC9585967.1 hypothetical protein [uncultured Gammaproteobacteria bacterium]SHN89548.1 hypothetical protein BHECKSOX_2014 [Bathymodiolus heckerae thiotrophic gill symbiont]
MNRKNIKKTLATGVVLLTLGMTSTTANALQKYEYIVIKIFEKYEKEDVDRRQSFGDIKIWVNKTKTKRLNEMGKLGWEYIHDEPTGQDGLKSLWFKRPIN